MLLIAYPYAPNLYINGTTKQQNHLNIDINSNNMLLYSSTPKIIKYLPNEIIPAISTSIPCCRSSP